MVGSLVLVSLAASAAAMAPLRVNAPETTSVSMIRTDFKQGRAAGHSVQERELTLETDDVTGIVRVVFDDLAGTGDKVFGDNGDADSFTIDIVPNFFSLKVTLDLEAEIFFDPCGEQVGAGIDFKGPLVLVPTVLDSTFLEFDLAFAEITVDLDDMGKAWPLPPVFDKVSGFKPTAYCVDIEMPQVPLVGEAGTLQACLELGNFTVMPSGIVTCPKITVTAGDSKLIEVTFADAVDLVGDLSQDKVRLDGLCLADSGCQCLALGYVPQCLYGDINTDPVVIESFRSLDVSNDFLVDFMELVQGNNLLGNFISESELLDRFNKMDADGDGLLDVLEFERAASANAEKSQKQPFDNTKSYSEATLAGSIVGGVIGGAMLLAGVAFLAEKAKPGLITARMQGTPQALQNL